MAKFLKRWRGWLARLEEGAPAGVDPGAPSKPAPSALAMTSTGALLLLLRTATAHTIVYMYMQLFCYYCR